MFRAKTHSREQETTSLTTEKKGFRALTALRQEPLKTIDYWQHSRVTWLIMLATALFLGVCSWGFQYVMYLNPCERCVYQRLAVLLLMLVPLIMMLAPKNPGIRIIGYALWLVAAAYGLDSAIDQLASYGEFDPFGAVCSMRPTFPFDLPLAQWWPAMFMPTGLCGSDNWSFLSLNMAQWMVIIFSIYLISAVVCVVSSLYCALIRRTS